MVTSEECIFCGIAQNKIPSKKIYENAETIAVLDINPASIGHVLVIPKKHYLNIQDTPAPVLTELIKTSKLMAERIKVRLNSEGLNILQNNGRLAGQLVGHIHFHLIPRYSNDNIAIHFPRAQLTEEQLNEVQKKLKEDESGPPSRPAFF